MCLTVNYKIPPPLPQIKINLTICLFWELWTGWRRVYASLEFWYVFFLIFSITTTHWRAGFSTGLFLMRENQTKDSTVELRYLKHSTKAYWHTHTKNQTTAGDFPTISVFLSCFSHSGPGRFQPAAADPWQPRQWSLPGRQKTLLWSPFWNGFLCVTGSPPKVVCLDDCGRRWKKIVFRELTIDSS